MIQTIYRFVCGFCGYIHDAGRPEDVPTSCPACSASRQPVTYSQHGINIDGWDHREFNPNAQTSGGHR